MAFRATVKKLGSFTRGDINPQLVNMWKHYYKVNGQISQTLSPYETKVFAPLFEHLGEKILIRLKIYFKAWGVPIIAGYGMVKFLVHKNHEHHYHERH